MPAQTTRRGRPRPTTTLLRDERIHALLTTAPRTRGDLVRETGELPSIVHLALKRLQHAGRVRQCAADGTIVWSVADGTPCP